MYTNVDLKISLYVCVHIKQYPENFAFLILRNLKLFAREVCKFLFLLFPNACKQTFNISDGLLSQNVKVVLM